MTDKILDDELDALTEILAKDIVHALQNACEHPHLYMRLHDALIAKGVRQRSADPSKQAADPENVADMFDLIAGRFGVMHFDTEDKRKGSN
ncbi:hypothetical protein KTR10_02975 [Candidatus Kaiserbacteria bacterium]|nr:hypothetical protein [Candidatus Kaiserbacteria bacterium]